MSLITPEFGVFFCYTPNFLISVVLHAVISLSYIAKCHSLSHFDFCKLNTVPFPKSNDNIFNGLSCNGVFKYSVCVSVCQLVSTLLAEPFHVQTNNLEEPLILTISRLKVKV